MYGTSHTLTSPNEHSSLRANYSTIPNVVHISLEARSTVNCFENKAKLCVAGYIPSMM